MREGTVRVHVTLSAELVRQVDRLAGKRRRSAFIAGAVEEGVKRGRLRRALEETGGALKGELPPEWETPQKTHEWTRKMRAAGDERLKRIWGDDKLPSS